MTALRYMVDTQRIAFVLVGFLGVFVGSFLYNAAAKRKNKKRLTDFQSFLFGTGFVYILLILWTMVTFVSDYFFGTALQGYNIRPDQNALFFAIFGRGVAGEDQFPLFAIDLNYLCAMFGALVGGITLLSVRADRNKIKGEDNGLFYGYRFPKRTVKEYFADEVRALREQVTPLEIVWWWFVRVCMIAALIYRIKKAQEGDSSTPILLLSVNLVIAFLVPLVRLVCFPKLFFGKMNYRVQSFILLFVFSGSFLGQGVGLQHSLDDYDKLLHLISGGVVVFVGWALIESTRRAAEIPRGLKTLASFGFSCVVMVVWEIFEFFSDFYMQGSINQNWHWEPGEDMFFYRLFGKGVGQPGMIVVLDTDIDIFLAFVGCVFCSVLLYAGLFLRDKARKKSLPDGEKKKETLKA